MNEDEERKPVAITVCDQCHCEIRVFHCGPRPRNAAEWRDKALHMRRVQCLCGSTVMDFAVHGGKLVASKIVVEFQSIFLEELGT